MRFESPPHIHVDSDFADVKSKSILPMSAWVHVVHTYQRGESEIYVNGRLDGATKPMLKIKSPARMWIGGWYNNFSFVGDIDEVRISKVARSADWIRLEYENQKPQQTLIGPLVQPGKAFSVSPEKATVSEGKSATFAAKAGGAQKVYWIVKRDRQEQIAAVDRFSFAFDAGRVVGDQPLTLRFKAVYANQVKTKDIPITIKEDIPEPAFTLKVPANGTAERPSRCGPRLSTARRWRPKAPASSITPGQFRASPCLKRNCTRETHPQEGRRIAVR